jgi:hypothetical protein
MNPLVNFKKRSITLPNGCKDLADVLPRPEGDQEGAIGRFVTLLLYMVHPLRAAELVIGPAEGEGTTIKFKIGGTWHEESALPSHMRPGVVTELARLAHLSEGPFPKEGTFGLAFGTTTVKWRLRIEGVHSKCSLTPVEE